MPNGKTNFIAGALVGATINFAIQSVQMAMDYDRKFDWGEFFLCAGAGAFIANPKGIASSSPGLRGTSYPGIPASNVYNPERVASSALGSNFHKTGNTAGVFETAAHPNHRRSFHTIVTAGLVAYAISGKHTLKLSRTTRLFLWAFAIGHLSHIALDSTTPKRINLL
jgi:Predicted membrane-bound metal-dependent hydrolase (DUF457).